MDFWVVAAATGAGYVAKNWQTLSGEKDGPSKLLPVTSPRVQPDTRQVFDKMPHSNFPLPKSATRCFLGDASSPEEEHNTVVADSDSIDRVYQCNMNEIDGKLEFSGHRIKGFRNKHTNVKPFSSLAVTSNSRSCRRKQMTQANEMIDHKIELGERNEALFEPTGLLMLPRRTKEMYVKKLETRDLYPQGDEMVPLFLGITIGILSTIVTNQHEVEHLNDLLEQVENMVRDLHDKLETKDRFTSKEHDTEVDGTAMHSPRSGNLELTSDIEAELKAELERLEENMKDCTLHRLHNVLEIDSDYEADMARGDLNLDSLLWRSETENQSESDHNETYDKGESTNNRIFTPNYAVSPLDLRLRLHEVIESELRARIEELEAVLENQNSSPNEPEPQEENSFWDFDHTRIESSSSTP